MQYNIGDDEYPDYARETTFEMPTGGNSKSVILARRMHQDGKSLKGWLMQYLGDDPESDYTLYKPGYTIEYPWDWNPEEAKTNVPDESNELETGDWEEPSAAIRRFMTNTHFLLVDDERVIRTIERYRR